jgi:hypothetical protein
MSQKPFRPLRSNEEAHHLSPSPAAVAFATRITEEQFRDVYVFAAMIDEIAEEARTNERKRIFKMGFMEMWREFWKGRKLYDPSKAP